MTVRESPTVVAPSDTLASAAPAAQQGPTPGTTPVVQPARTVAQPTTDVRPVADTRPIGGGQLVRRIAILVFGLIQIVIGLRIVLLLLDARTGNALVSGILDVSKIFVAPFEGILNTNALASGGSVLDVSAIVAFIGWSILELIILWAVGIFRREPD
jgi:hypothetical protein